MKKKDPKLYITADQQPFFDERSALRHASKLADKEITIIQQSKVDDLLHQLETGEYEDNDY